MGTKEKLEIALKNAMKSGNEVRKRTLRLALSSIKLAEIDKGQPLDEAGIISILNKEMKAHEETITEAQRAGRQDMVTENQAEIEVLQEFLPQPLSAAELEDIVRQVITESGATSPADMGKVMKLLIPRLAGRAGGNEASNLVRRLLQG